MTDHPRTCGENPRLLPLFLCRIGSPPHMRGKLKEYDKHEADTRITPAHAGKTLPPYDQIPPDSDHPRTCGENKAGKAEMGPDCWITPAHAGKTLSTSL